AARFVSSLFGLLIVLAAYLLAAELMGAKAALVVAALVGFTPAVVNLSSTINNEVAAAGLGALALAFAVRLVTRGGDAVRAGLLIGSLCAAAALAKLTGLFGLPVAVLAGLLAPNLTLGGARGPRARLVYAALVLALPAVAMGAWYASVGPDWGLVVYDSELGGAAGAAGPWFLTPFDPAVWPRFALALPRLFASYWGMLGAVSGAFYLPDFVYTALGVLCLAGLAGLGAFALRRDDWTAWAPARRRALLVVLVAVVLLTYVVAARTGQARTAEGFDGRHLLSITGAYAALLVLGLSNLLPRRPLAPGAVLGLATLLAVTLAAPSLFKGAVYLPEAPIARASAALPERAVFANGLALVDVDFPADSLRPGASVPARLRWRVDRPLGGNFEAALLFIAGDGKPYLLHQAMPLREVLPPVGWLPGDVVTDERQLTVPAGIPLGPGRVELHVVNADGSLLASKDGGARPLDLGAARIRPATVADAAIKTKVGAIFGDKLELVGYSLGAQEGKAGQSLPVELFWRATAALPEDYVVSLQLLGPNGVVAQQDGQPLAGTYPTSRWVKGDVVWDQRTLALPANVATGNYQLLAVVYRYPSLERLPASAAEAQRDYVTLGTLVVGQ
ncbi:MAG: glycosyltransferase family 39 protein, partial [Chloroflexota bacterium]